MKPVPILPRLAAYAAAHELAIHYPADLHYHDARTLSFAPVGAEYLHTLDEYGSHLIRIKAGQTAGETAVDYLIKSRPRHWHHVTITESAMADPFIGPLGLVKQVTPETARALNRAPAPADLWCWIGAGFNACLFEGSTLRATITPPVNRLGYGIKITGRPFVHFATSRLCADFAEEYFHLTRDRHGRLVIAQ